MTKKITVMIDNITRADDPNSVYSTIDSIIEAIYDWEGIVTRVHFDRTPSSFAIFFNLKVCRDGDLFWILIKEYLSTILETEDHLDITIDEVEEDGNGMTIKLFKYKAKNETF